MPVSRVLKIPCSDASQIAIPCEKENCAGETVVDLIKAPSQGEIFHTRCPLCQNVTSKDVSDLLALFQSVLKRDVNKKASFYFLVADTREPERV